MAKQDSVIKFVGQIDGLSYYKSVYGYITRKKGGPSKKQVKESPKFQRVREQNALFGRASKGGKLIRSAFHDVLKFSSDALMNSRLNKLITQIISTDNTHVRGERTITGGQKELLRGFEFNKKVNFNSVFNAVYATSVNKSTGEFTFDVPEFKPSVAVVAPKAATHFKIVVRAAAFDFEKGKYKSVCVESEMMKAGLNEVRSISLTERLEAGDNVVLTVAGIQFFDEFNGKYERLMDKGFNGVAVVGVDATVRVTVEGAKGAEGAKDLTQRRKDAEGAENNLRGRVVDGDVFSEGWVNELHLN